MKGSAMSDSTVQFLVKSLTALVLAVVGALVPDRTSGNILVGAAVGLLGGEGLRPAIQASRKAADE